MKHLSIAKIVVSWITNYVVNFCIYLLIKLCYHANDRYYKFEYEDETYKIKLNRQDLETLNYIYQEELNVGDTDKFDGEYMAMYRSRYLRANKIKQLRILSSEGEIIISDNE